MKQIIMEWIYVRRKVCEISLGLFVLSIFVFILQTGALLPLEHLLLDAHFHLKPLRQASQKIILVAVDEESLDVFGRWPWSRDKHGALVGVLKNESFRPAVLGYDLLFENENEADTESDDLFVRQTADFDNPVVMAYFFEKGFGAQVETDVSKEIYLENFALKNVEWVPPEIEKAQRTSLPFLKLSEVSELAFVNTPIDPDGRTRRAQLLIEYKGNVYPSMDVLVAMYYLQAKLDEMRLVRNKIILPQTVYGRLEIPVNDYGEMLINYDSRASSVPVYSFVDVIEEAERWMQGKSGPERLKQFKDSIVLVGVSALGLGDRRVTPMHQYETGINLHAQAIQNIVTGSFLVDFSQLNNIMTVIIIGFAVILMTHKFRISISLPAVALLYLAFFLLAHLAFLFGMWMYTATHLFVVIFIFITMTSFRYFLALEDLKRTQDQLIHSSKMAALGQMSAGIGHEFRNILTAINLNIEYCNRVANDPEKLNKGLTRIMPVLKSANMVLTSLLMFSRKNTPEKKETDLQRLIEETLLLVEKEMTNRQISLESDLEDVGEILCDPGQLSQVMINMLNNARDALKDQSDKQIHIKLYKNNDCAVIEIADNGSGIPEHIKKNLFQPFMTSKARGEGTGLGLSVCYGIVKNHHGTIEVDSKKGEGTKWVISLPFSAEDSATQK